jgi:hypothetical protein
MKVRLITKTIVLAIIIFIYKIAMNFIEPLVTPLITNELVMNQMNNKVDSNLWLQLYTYATNYAWVGLAVIIVALYCREVLEIFDLIKEKRNEEN